MSYLYDTSNIIGVIGSNGEQLAGGFHPNIFSSGRFSGLGSMAYTGGQGASAYSGGQGTPAYDLDQRSAGAALSQSFPQSMSGYPQFDGMNYEGNAYSSGQSLYNNFNGISQSVLTRLMGGVPSYDRDQHKPQPPPPGQKNIPNFVFNYDDGTVTPLNIF